MPDPLTPPLSGGDDLTAAGTPAAGERASSASRITPSEEVDLRIARTLLAEALTRLGRVSGKGGVAGALVALIGRLGEPPPQPSRPPDLWTDVRSSVAGLHAVCLANGIPAERAHQFVDAHAAVLADCIEGLAEEVRGG